MIWASLVAQSIKNSPAMWETWVRSLGGEDPLEEGMATHSSILAWRIPWTEEPGGLQSIGSQRVGHDWSTKHVTQHDLAAPFLGSGNENTNQKSYLHPQCSLQHQLQ